MSPALGPRAATILPNAEALLEHKDDSVRRAAMTVVASVGRNSPEVASRVIQLALKQDEEPQDNGFAYYISRFGEHAVSALRAKQRPT